MTPILSTHAKQCFGQLLKASETEPVVIEKHGKVHLFVVSAAYFAGTTSNEYKNNLFECKLACMRQSGVKKNRLTRHQKIAFELATLPEEQRNKLIDTAKAVVARWRAEKLCSSDYIEIWERILSMKPVEMAEAMISDTEGWGSSLRQNPPWVGLYA